MNIKHKKKLVAEVLKNQNSRPQPLKLPKYSESITERESPKKVEQPTFSSNPFYLIAQPKCEVKIGMAF